MLLFQPQLCSYNYIGMYVCTYSDPNTYLHSRTVDIGAKSFRGFTRQIDEVLVAATSLRDVCVTRQRRTVHGPRPFLVLFPNSHIPMVSRRCRLAWNGKMVWGSPGPLCPFVSFFSLPLASVRCLFCKQQQSNSKCNYNATSTHFLHSLFAELRVWSHAKLVWQMLLEVSGPRPLVPFFSQPR